MTRRKGSISAADLMAELRANPEWVAQNAEREAKWSATELRFRAEEEPMIVDLAKLGFEVSSVWDLVNTNKSYPAAIPTLIDHLRRPYHERIRNGIIRALTVKEAKGLAGGVILDELQNEANKENRWALANALSVTADKKDASAIKALLDDPAYEDVSERLGEALKSLR